MINKRIKKSLIVQYIVCCVFCFLSLVCPMLLVSLDCPFLIAPSMFILKMKESECCFLHSINCDDFIIPMIPIIILALEVLNISFVFLTE
jgi:hypothetical protein